MYADVLACDSAVRSKALDNGTCTNTFPASCTVKGLVGSHAYALWDDSKPDTRLAPDITAWQLAPHKSDAASNAVAGGYSLAAPFTNGSTHTFSHREEPKLLFQGGRGTGEPRRATHLFNAACPNVVPHVCGEVLAVPIEPAIELWEPSPREGQH